jgi:hypothetical protein
LSHFLEIPSKRGFKKVFGGDKLDDYIQYINGQFPWLLIVAQIIYDKVIE